MKRLFFLAADLTAFAILAALTYRLLRNLRWLRHARQSAQPTASATASAVEPLPSVSVLVPARDEAQVIAACIDSLVRQDYPNVEIIALDDQSRDATGAILDELAARHPNITVIHGGENPPAGWNGKSYACLRLAERSGSEWLLFTDADTQHEATSITQGIALADSLGVDLLSAFPRQITQTWSERIAVSFIVDFLPLIGVDLVGLWRGTSNAVAANGQYVLVRAAAYRAVGGHAAIAHALVDDFALAQRFRSCGYRVALVDGTSILRCRMYHNAGEVWAGFSKNLMLALETNAAQPSLWLAPLFAWGYACIFVLPFARLLLSNRRLPLIEIGWLALLRLMVNQQFARPVDEVITTPLASWSVMALGLNALINRQRGAAIRWKGRDYQPSA